MIKLLIIAILAFLLYVILRGLLAKRRLSVRQFMMVYLATVAGLLLLFLAVTGRLHPLFAVLGVVLPFLFRMTGIIMQGAQFAAIIRALKSGMPGRGPSSAPSKSEISSRFIHMVLFHDTGMMEGRVLDGQFKDAKLSELSLDRLLELLSEVSVDADSHNLLIAYLDREHEGWDSNTRRETPPESTSDRMTEAQALDILGLQAGADADAVRKAHRRMMQKVHPDRGGSTYLATRINAAKEFLLKLYQ